MKFWNISFYHKIYKKYNFQLLVKIFFYELKYIFLFKEFPLFDTRTNQKKEFHLSISSPFYFISALEKYLLKEKKSIFIDFGSGDGKVIRCLSQNMTCSYFFGYEIKHNLVNISKKKIKSFKIFNKLISIFFKIYIKLSKKEKNDSILNYKFSELMFSEINKFNFLYESNSKFPLEIRNINNLKNYLQVISDKKKIYFMLIKKKQKLLGYAILVGEKIKNSNIRRINLGQIRLLDESLKNINEIFYEIALFAKKKNCSLVEFRNLNKKILKNLNKKKFFMRNLENNPYLIILKNKNSKLKKYLKNDLDTSYLNGDCLV